MVCKKLPLFWGGGLGGGGNLGTHKTKSDIVFSNQLGYIEKSHNPCLRLEYKYQYLFAASLKTVHRQVTFIS